MRDPNRIDPLLQLSAEAWHEEPDLRLGQLLINAARLAGWGSTDIFLAEDRLLEKGSHRYLQRRQDTPRPDGAQPG